MPTTIEWTDVTDNIIVAEGGGWWCRMCSEGCANCYAARLNQNDFFGGNHLPYSGSAPALVLRRDILAGWARQTKPKRHFVASMTDVFGEWVPKEWCFEFLDAMAAAPLQTFQVLTKRAARMREVVTEWLRCGMRTNVPMHIWLGVSAENQQWFDARVSDLIEIPAVRFVSCEPLLAYINPEPWIGRTEARGYGVGAGIHWIIIGGESGPCARPSNMLWHESLVRECLHHGVAVFEKQLGSRVTHGNDVPLNPPLQHGKGGDMSEWPENLCVREFPKIEVAA